MLAVYSVTCSKLVSYVCNVHIVVLNVLCLVFCWFGMWWVCSDYLGLWLSYIFPYYAIFESNLHNLHNLDVEVASGLTKP